MAELKPCPFCGGTAKIRGKQHRYHGGLARGNKKLSWKIYVKCNKCHARGRPIVTEPIKLFPDGLPAAGCGSFYSTEYWCGSGRGGMIATLTFEPYVEKAIEAWDGRARFEN